MRTLITGGVKAGKSRYALALAREDFGDPKLFIATATVLDEEMALRIARHQAERETREFGTFVTLEEPLRIDRALREAAPSYAGTVLDCLPMWTNNLMHLQKEEEFEEILSGYLAALPEAVVVVTNETGLGNIPFDPYTRRYNRLLAEANRRSAEVCDRVILMVSGIPLRIK